MKTKVSFTFPLVVLTIIFCTCLIVANIIAGKLWATPLASVVLTAGVFCFPLVYIIVDVIPEVYGYATARKVIFLGFAANLLAVFFFWLCLIAPFPPFFQGQDAFNTVLGFTPRLLFASFTAYLVGTNLNAWSLTIIKKWTKGKYLWMRTIGSTIVGESVDSTIFMLIAFWGILPPEVLPGMILAQATFKTLYETLATPFTYLVIDYFKRMEGIPANNYVATIIEEGPRKRPRSEML